MSEFESANFFADRSIQDDPYPYFDWVRAQSPVWREPNYGLYIITGHPEAMADLRRPSVLPSERPAFWDLLVMQRGEREVREVLVAVRG